MSFEGVKTNKLNGGLGGENPTDDNVFALVYVVPLADLPVGAVHNTFYQIFSIDTLNTLGFTASWDAAEKLLVNAFATEHFRLCPDQPFYLVPVASGQTATAIMTLAAFRNALKDTKTKGLLIANTAETLLSVDDQAETVQAQINSLAAEGHELDFVILDGRGEATVTTIANYPDLRLKNAGNVSVCVAQDPTIAVLDAAYGKYSDLGAVMGMLAIRGVNENLGSVDVIKKPAAKRGDESYPLTEGTRWASACLSDGKKVSELSAAEKKSLTDKGYIYAGSYPSYPGIYFNNSPTCVQVASDYAFIERNRTWNKASRLIRNALMPKVKSVLKKDPVTGFIRSTTISDLTGRANKALDRMVAADEISGYQITIAANQAPGPSTPLKVKAKVISDDIVHTFELDLGLAKTI